MNRGSCGESSSACRKRLMTEFMPCSNSTIVPLGQSLSIQFPACDHFAGVFQQHRQDLDGLIGNPNLYTVPPQFSGLKIQFEGPKSDHRIVACGTHPHCSRGEV